MAKFLRCEKCRFYSIKDSSFHGVRLIKKVASKKIASQYHTNSMNHDDLLKNYDHDSDSWDGGHTPESSSATSPTARSHKNRSWTCALWAGKFINSDDEQIHSGAFEYQCVRYLTINATVAGAIGGCRVKSVLLLLMAASPPLSELLDIIKTMSGASV